MILRFLPEGEPAFELEGPAPRPNGRVYINGEWWMIHHVEYVVHIGDLIAEIDMMPLTKIEKRARHPDSGIHS